MSVPTPEEFHGLVRSPTPVTVRDEHVEAVVSLAVYLAVREQAERDRVTGSAGAREFLIHLWGEVTARCGAELLRAQGWAARASGSTVVVTVPAPPLADAPGRVVTAKA